MDIYFERASELMGLLLGGRRWTVRDLAERQGVHPRTTRRHLAAIRRRYRHLLRCAYEPFDYRNHYWPEFLTPIGWWNWSLCMARAGRWVAALEQLEGCEALWRKAPPLAMLEGILNAAMLLPEEYRHFALEDVPLYSDIGPVHTPATTDHHARSTHCFCFVAERLRDVADADLRRYSRSVDPMDPSDESRYRSISQGPQGARGIYAFRA